VGPFNARLSDELPELISVMRLAGWASFHGLSAAQRRGHRHPPSEERFLKAVIAGVRGLCKRGAAMRTVILILGIAAALMGLLWIGQGAGLVHWPASSFMIDRRPWIARGAVLTVIGLFLVTVSRRRR
jgi:hypothetical protein